MSHSVVSQSAVSSDQISGVQDVVCPVIDSVKKIRLFMSMQVYSSYQNPRNEFEDNWQTYLSLIITLFCFPNFTINTIVEKKQKKRSTNSPLPMARTNPAKFHPKITQSRTTFDCQT